MAVFSVEFMRAVKACARGNIYLAPYNGLYPACLCGLVEIDGAVHYAMVCYCNSRHAELSGTCGEL